MTYQRNRSGTKSNPSPKKREHTSESELILRASKIWHRGGLVAFPTETVYGLGANALSESAIKKIYQAKGRPSDNPLIVHIGYKKDLTKYAQNIPATAKKLIQKFWPGPLTLILEKTKRVPNITTGNLNTIAIRMPNHPLALKLLRQTNLPIAAPSANLSGKPSPTHAHHVRSDFQNKIDLIIDGGPTTIGLESTVIDLTVSPPIILRPGSITPQMIEKIIGPVETIHHSQKPSKTVKSPGLKYRHYSPEAKVVLLTLPEKNAKNTEKKLLEFFQTQPTSKKKIAFLTPHPEKFPLLKKTFPQIFFNMGKTEKSFAKNLFHTFRTLDEQNYHTIYIPELHTKELGLAIMNRMHKAASKTLKI